MGKVRETVKGTKSTRTPAGSTESTIERIRGIRDELSELCAAKESDIVTEGDENAPKNILSAARLRGAHSMMTAAIRLLEDY